MKVLLMAASAAVVLFATPVLASPESEARQLEARRAADQAAGYGQYRASSRGSASRAACPADHFCPIDQLYDPTIGSLVEGYVVYRQSPERYWALVNESRTVCHGAGITPRRGSRWASLEVSGNARYRFDGGSVGVRGRVDPVRGIAENRYAQQRNAAYVLRNYCADFKSQDTERRSIPRSEMR